MFNAVQFAYDFQLALASCLTVELPFLQVKDFLVISDNSFSRQQVLSTEKSILNKLQWNLTVPTMYMFILRYLKAALGDEEVTNKHSPFSVVLLLVLYIFNVL